MFDEIHIFYACEDSLLVKDTSDKAHSKALEHFAGKGHAAILRFWGWLKVPIANMLNLLPACEDWHCHKWILQLLYGGLTNKKG